MEETSAVHGEPQVIADAPPEKAARRRLPLGSILSFIVGLVGVSALGATSWVYTETQRDILRISTDIAQIRLSLELFGRQQQPAPTADSALAGNESLLDLSNRLAILEQNWRNGTPSAGAPPATLPSIAPNSAAAGAGGDDCLPTGTRFMVSAGDSYPVCGTTGSVAIAAVDNGFLTLSDGTVIAQGGTVGLPGTQCMIGMMPSDGGSLSGYAEIRVVC